MNNLTKGPHVFTHFSFHSDVERMDNTIVTIVTIVIVVVDVVVVVSIRSSLCRRVVD